MLTNYDSTLFRVRANFFANRHEVAFKAQDVTTTLAKAGDFTLSRMPLSANTLKFYDDGSQISLKVSDEAIKSLKNRFGDGNFISLKDGSTALTGNAAAFVDGWYKDITQNRGFAKADADGNGKIECGENVRFLGTLTQEAYLSEKDGYQVFGASKDFAYQSGSNSGKFSVSELLDLAILSDKNGNGKITFLEAYAGKDTLSQGYEKWLNSYLRGFFGDESLKIDTYGIIEKRLNDENAMSKGLYDESVFDGSSYGGANALNTARFVRLEKDLTEPDNVFKGLRAEKIKEDTDYISNEEALIAKYLEFRAIIE